MAGDRRRHLTGAFLCTQEAIRMMKAQDPRGGRIITMARSAPTGAPPAQRALHCTKHAITADQSTILGRKAFDTRQARLIS